MILHHCMPKESDWKLFNVKIVSWQEEYMKKLNEELFINVKKGYGKELKEKFKKFFSHDNGI